MNCFVTVDKAPGQMATVRCGCGFEAYFTIYTNALYSGERHARRNKAELVALINGEPDAELKNKKARPTGPRPGIAMYLQQNQSGE